MQLLIPDHYRTNLRLFLLLFATTVTLFSILLWLFFQKEYRDFLHITKEQESYKIELQQQQIALVMEGLLSDLFFLRDQNELDQYLQTNDTSYLKKAGVEYVSLARRSRAYDQIRYLDQQGLERLRVNFNAGNPELVPIEQLQLKSGRYYFQECTALANNQIFLSPLDLNVEHGLVEIPYKPVIRLCTPVFSSMGYRRGVILLNYLGQDLLRIILASEKIAIGRTMLLNKDGYWLLHPEKKKSWGFMFDDRQQVSFAVQNPAVWKSIQSADDGQLMTATGLYTFATIRPLELLTRKITAVNAAALTGKAPSVDSYHWHLISHASRQELDRYSQQALVQLYPLAIGLTLIAAAGSWLLSLAITRRKKVQDKLRAMAYFDPLTDLPNRRHFFDRLEEAVSHGSRYNDRLALLYIDLDGFKQTNDAFGHQIGDILLCHVADCLRKICRKSDTVARLGGDEFALLLPNAGTQESIATVAAKVIAILSQPTDIRGNKVQVGASIGIAFFPNDGDRVDTLVKRADSAMYLAKSQGKNQYLFFADTQPPAT